MKFKSRHRQLLFVFLLLTTFPASSKADLPATVILLPSNCAGDSSNCPGYLYSRCSGSSCTACSSSSDCDHISGGTGQGSCQSYNGDMICIVSCTSSNQQLCLAMRGFCDTSENRCRQCWDDSQCTGIGYPGTSIRCDTSGSIGVCTSCPSGGCSVGACQNYKCVQCTTDAQCSGSTPHCLVQFQGNFCKACTDNSHCTSSASTSACSTSTYTCVKCTTQSDCSLISGKPYCGSSGCVECTSNTHCSGSTPICSSSGTCVACGANTDCPSASLALCSPSNTCVGCTSTPSVCSSRYPTTLPQCSSSGVCVQCTSNTHCSSPTPACSSSNTCVQCTQSADCPSASLALCSSSNTCVGCTSTPSVCSSRYPSTLPQCSSSGVCVQCTSNTHCSNPTPACSSSNTCVQCTQSSDCPSASLALCSSGNTCTTCTSSPSVCSSRYPGTLPYCSSGGVCVECTQSSECPSASLAYCSASFTCTSCTSSPSVCGSRYPSTLPYCSTSGICVQCTSDTHCSGSTPHCSSAGVCVECTASSHCGSTSLPYCSSSNTCVSCTTSPSICSSKYSGTYPYCNSAGACVECLTNGNCLTSSKPACSTSNTCVECTDSSFCLTPALPDCSSASNTCIGCTTSSASALCPGKYSGLLPFCFTNSGACVECLADTDCPAAEPNCNSNVCEPNVYEATCQPTYNIQITQNSNTFNLKFPSELVSQVNITTSLNLTLKNIPSSDYSYTLNKLSETRYQALFTFQATIPSTYIILSLPCPPQRGFIYGNIYISTAVPKILYTPPSVQDTIDTITSLASTTTTVMASASGSMMIAGANPAIMWALIGLLQTFYYMIFINVEYPANVQAFFSLFTLGNLSFIPNPTTWFFPNIDNESLDAPAKFLENDVNGLFLQTAGNMLLTWFGVIAGYAVSKLFLKFTRNMPKLLTSGASKTITMVEWSGVYRTLITSYTQLVMAAFLQVRVLTFNGALFSISSGAGIAFIPFAFMFPFVTWLAIRQNSPKKRLMHLKYSTLIEEYKFAEAYPIAKYFNVFFLLRRLALCLTLVFLHNYPYIEIFFLVINCLVWTVLLWRYLPYDTAINNVVNIVSEVCFVGIHIIIFLLIHDDFTDWLTDDERLNLGWGIIGGCASILVMTLVSSFVQQYFVLKKMIQLLIKVVKGKPAVKRKRRIKRKFSPEVHPQNESETLDLSPSDRSQASSRDLLQISTNGSPDETVTMVNNGVQGTRHRVKHKLIIPKKSMVLNKKTDVSDNE